MAKLNDSPISVESLTAMRKFNDILINCSGSQLFWSETYKKKVKIYSYEINSIEINPHKMIHKVGGGIGYGGGGWSSYDRYIYYIDAGRLFQYDTVTRKNKKLLVKTGSIASPVASPCGQWIAYIHRNEDEFDSLGIVDSEGKNWPFKICDQFDFYTQLRWSPCGKKIAFVAWNHPNLPWIKSAVYLADFVVDHQIPKLINIKKISGDWEHAVFQPEFSKDEKKIYFMADTTGWSQLYEYDMETEQTQQVSFIDGECAQPNWVQDMRTWSLMQDKVAYIIATKNAVMSIYRLNLKTKKSELVQELEQWTELHQLIGHNKSGNIAMIASSPQRSPEIILFSTNEKSLCTVRKSEHKFPIELMTSPKTIEWKSSEGETVTGLLWASQKSSQDKSPLLVKVHSGPTSQARVNWDLELQFFASRGVNVFCVNYRGSSGFGRDYMKSLNGNYGISDVEDLIDGVKQLEKEGLANRNQAIVWGSSSGGYTVLQTMTMHPDFFAGGISAYGISDLISLGENTHKFEKFYNDILVAPSSEGDSVLKMRSPLYKVKNVKKPMILFHGGRDDVVSYLQTEKFIEGLKLINSPYHYYFYPEEGHGFRLSETREHYYSKVLDFIEEINGITVEN